MYNVKVEFSFDVGKDSFNGLFREDLKLGITKAKEFKIIDQISPFIGAIMDWYCDESRDAPVTKVFAGYDDLLRLLTSDPIDVIAWDEWSLSYLNDAIKKFKKVAVEVLGYYQQSNMWTLKWPMLDNVINDLRRIGNLQ